MSRSVSSLRASAVSAVFSAYSRTILAACDYARPDGKAATPGAVVPEPSSSTHSFNAPREIPRSTAMPCNVAAGVDSYKSTARRRNSSV